jgi:hypothetical protein
MGNENMNTEPILIFISYSHENEIWLTEWLDPVLQTVNPRCLLKQWQRTFRNENVEFWFDRERDKGLRGGERWRERIFKEIDKADIALLLVTQQFVISPFIMNEELPHILTRHKKHEMEVLPLLVQPTRLKDLPTGDFLQWAPGKPTPLSSYFERGDNAFAEACNEVLDALEGSIVRAREKRSPIVQESTHSSQRNDADIKQKVISPEKKSSITTVGITTNEKDRTLQSSSDGHSSEPYVPIIGILIKDSTDTETKLTEFGIVYNPYAKNTLDNAVKDSLIVERGKAGQNILWNLIEYVVVQGKDTSSIRLRGGKSLDNIKLRAGTLVGKDDLGFDFALQFNDWRTITPLRDTSLPEREALIRDIPILVKRTLPNSSYTYNFKLEPDKEGILVTLDVFFQNKLETNGNQTFRMPDRHVFLASGDSVRITIMSIGLINLGLYDVGTAYTLAQALNRLNTLLFEEISGTNDGDVSQHSDVSSHLTEKQDISTEGLTIESPIVHPETGTLTSGDFSAVEDTAAEYASEVKKVPFLAVIKKDKLQEFAQRLQGNNQFEKRVPRSVAIIYRLYAAALLLSKSENIMTPTRQCVPWLQRSIELFTDFKDKKELQASQVFLNGILIGQAESVSAEIFMHHCFRVAMVDATEEEVNILSEQAIENLNRVINNMNKP